MKLDELTWHRAYGSVDRARAYAWHEKYGHVTIGWYGSAGFNVVTGDECTVGKDTFGRRLLVHAPAFELASLLLSCEPVGARSPDVWVSADGRKAPIDELDTSHIVNALAKVRAQWPWRSCWLPHLEAELARRLIELSYLSDAECDHDPIPGTPWSLR